MIYLDHASTSPMRPEVVAAMEPWMGVPANPASVHQLGQRAAAALEEAREHVAALVGGLAEGVVFTSGATEANHLAIRGGARLFEARTQTKGRWWVSPIEHPCVLAATEVLAERGWEVVRGEVHRSGTCILPDLSEFDGASLMAANHETGVLQPVASLLAASADGLCFTHIDATQSVGRCALDLSKANAVALSGHKIGGPPGIGAAVLADGEPFPAVLGGGAQERSRRAGTVPTMLAVGLGEACRLAQHERAAHREWMTSALADLDAAVLQAGGVRVFDPDTPFVPGHRLYVFEGLEGEQIVQSLDLMGICVSSGAACASGSLEPSPVLSAMKHPHPTGGLRVTLGWSSSRPDVETLIQAIGPAVSAIRASMDWESL